MNVFARLGIRRVINAAGKMTYLGASAVEPEVAGAMAEAARSYVEMDRLYLIAGKRISRATGAEAGMVTPCAAAGIAIATAACIAGDSLAVAQQLPDAVGRPNELVIQKGHAINFGAPLVQMLRMAGGKPVEIGTVNECRHEYLTDAAWERTAAVVFVVSHHCVQSGMLGLAEVVEVAHARQVPVIVDAAAEVDLRKFIATGADLVVYSGHKAIGGPTSGMIAGRADLIARCRLQNQGIGRSMKIGKEGIVGFLAALERYETLDASREELAGRKLALTLCERLSGLTGVKAELSLDGTRPIWRLKLTLGSDAELTARELIQRLENGDPAVRSRNHQADEGIIQLDSRTLREEDIASLVERVRSELEGGTVHA